MTTVAYNEPTLATPSNMRRFRNEKSGRCHVISMNTEEEYSADAGDYWNYPDDQPLKDEMGEPMVLATSRTTFHDALTGEEI